MEDNPGKLIIVIGSVILVVGIFVYLFWDKFGWIGNLPGDIKIDKPGLKIYIPITTMIIISLITSGIIWIINQLR